MHLEKYTSYSFSKYSFSFSILIFLFFFLFLKITTYIISTKFSVRVTYLFDEALTFNGQNFVIILSYAISISHKILSSLKPMFFDLSICNKFLMGRKMIAVILRQSKEESFDFINIKNNTTQLTCFSLCYTVFFL